MFRRYSKLLVNFPYAVLAVLLALVAAIAIALFQTVDMPSFSDPTLGFHAAKTSIRGWESAGILLQDKVDRGELLCSPFCQTRIMTKLWSQRRGKERKKTNRTNEQFCGPNLDPRRLYPLMVFESINEGESLMDAKAINEICQIEQAIFQDYSPMTFNCTHSLHHSLGYYLNLLTRIKQPRCHVTETTVNLGVRQLRRCLPYYKLGLLKGCYFRGPNSLYCKALTNMSCPPDIAQAAFIIFNYIVDKDYMIESDRVSLTALHVRSLANQDTLEEFYHSRLDQIDLTREKVQVTGLRLGIEYNLFLEYTVKTLMLFAVAISLIIISMFIYQQSILLTISTCLLVGFSFVTAWFIYAIIFGYTYFPTMNCMAGLMLIAIGADDVFVWYDIWQQIIIEKPHAKQEEHVYQTMKHAASSIFVTSFTTASAFFSNAVSDITDIKLFGIFAGLGILMNFFFMITWIPAMIIVSERLHERFCVAMSQVSLQRLEELKKVQRRLSKIVFGQVLPLLIEKLWWLWLIVLTGLGISMIVAVVEDPGLRLPESEDFQLYKASHPFEIYTFQQKQRFKFSTDFKLHVPVTYIWGVEGQDNAAWYKPKDRGTLVFDDSFEFYSPETQNFFKHFCRNLLKSSIPKKMENPSCFFDRVHTIMRTPCHAPRAIKGCCGRNPVSAIALKTCLPKIQKCIVDLKCTNTADKNLIPTGELIDYPIFDKSFKVKAYAVAITTSAQMTFSYSRIRDAYNEVKSFLKNQTDTGPIRAKYGWFTTRFFGYYDLQLSLSSGSYIAIAVSLGVAFLVMLLTSLNILITIYAMLTIAMSIFVTVGILVFAGWKLNILESIAISLAVGLSIDFAIHYGVAYRLSKDNLRVDRMKRSFQRVGAAVFMAAATTFISGLAIMPTILHSYRQMGTFLMTVMAISWLYATFYFQSLCRIMGPQGNFGQIPSPCAQCFKSRRESNSLPVSVPLTPQLESAEEDDRQDESGTKETTCLASEANASDSKDDGTSQHI